MLVGNLFAYRATQPRVLKAAPAPVGPDNDRLLQQLVTHAVLQQDPSLQQRVREVHPQVSFYRLAAEQSM